MALIYAILLSMKNLYTSFQPILSSTGLSHFGLSLQQTNSCETLQGVVHSYLQIRTDRATAYPVIPDASQAIFISDTGSIIGGAQLQARDLYLPQAGEYFGIRFYPAALRHFFDLNVAEITNQYVNNQFFPCQCFAELHNILYQNSSFLQRSDLCEQWLLKNFRPQPMSAFDHALSLIYQSHGGIKVSQLATVVGWSSRHLNRLFRFNTGLSTKLFIQIIRLQQVCKQLYTESSDSLNTAFQFGFFDQSHLLRDYKKRMLTSPNLFQKRFMSDFYNS